MARKIIAPLMCQYDFYQKLIYTNPEVLPYLIKLSIPEYRDISIKEIRDKYLPKCMYKVTDHGYQHYASLRKDLLSGLAAASKASGKPKEVDILLKLPYPGKEGRFIYVDIECQKNQTNFQARSEIYSSQILSVLNPTEKTIDPVYIIWLRTNRDGKCIRHAIIDKDFYEHRRGTPISSVRKVKNSHVHIVEINLSNTPDPKMDKALQLLEVLSSKTMSVKEKEAYMAHLNIPVSTELHNDIDRSWNLGQDIWAKGHKTGHKKGHKEGHKEGFNEHESMQKLAMAFLVKHGREAEIPKLISSRDFLEKTVKEAKATSSNKSK